LHGQAHKEGYRIDIETPSAHAEFKLDSSQFEFNFSHATEMYLVAEDEYVYSKITTVNPYFIFVNQTNYTVLVEQAESN